jgi:hypothetical protein
LLLRCCKEIITMDLSFKNNSCDKAS